MRAKVDTDADRSSLDFDLAAAVGAGPVTDTVSVRSSGTHERRSRPVVEVVIGIRGAKHVIEADLEDRDHMDYQMLLGRDVLEGYEGPAKRGPIQLEITDSNALFNLCE